MMNKNHENHVVLWTWLSKNPSKDKKDYFKENKIPNEKQPINGCYACAETETRDISGVKCCKRCPLNWGDNKNCFDNGTLFDRWTLSTDPTRRSELAKQIAEMEWRGTKHERI